MSDNYESAANRAEAAPDFRHAPQPLSRKMQHTLHTSPSLVPVTVLVGAVIVFDIALGDRFLSPFALTLILQQV